MEEPFGPTLEGMWRMCHGCEAVASVDQEVHAPDCPGICVRERCPYHPKVVEE